MGDMIQSKVTAAAETTTHICLPECKLLANISAPWTLFAQQSDSL